MASQSTSVEFLPGLLDGLERLEARWIAPPRNPLLRLPHVLTGGLRMTIARWRMRVEVQRSMRRAPDQRFGIDGGARGAAREGGANLCA